jgi:hypothetical protein
MVVQAMGSKHARAMSCRPMASASYSALREYGKKMPRAKAAFCVKYNASAQKVTIRGSVYSFFTLMHNAHVSKTNENAYNKNNDPFLCLQL